MSLNSSGSKGRSHRTKTAVDVAAPYNAAMRLHLRPHPSTPSPGVDLFEVQLERLNASVAVCYRVQGTTDDLLVPEIRSSMREHGLWQHTCFELFARSDTGTRYREFNLSPSTCWAAYDFDDYRSGMKDAPGVAPPSIRIEKLPQQFSLEALLPCAALTGTSTQTVHLGLAAVLEHRDRRKSYWALVHPAEKPDFHHPGAFTLALDIGVA